MALVKENVGNEAGVAATRVAFLKMTAVRNAPHGSLRNEVIREKPHRLPIKAYQGEKYVSFTACAENRLNIFRDAALIADLVEELRIATESFECIVPIYCFMPDHLHAIVKGETANANGKFAFDEFKHETGMLLAEREIGDGWQKGYHDRIIRTSDDWRKKLTYIANNPVRDGLVDDWADYPFTGTIGCTWDQVLPD